MENEKIIIWEYNKDKKEFKFLGHKIDYINNPSEFKKYLNELISENKCLHLIMQDLKVYLFLNSTRLQNMTGPNFTTVGQAIYEEILKKISDLEVKYGKIQRNNKTIK